LEVRLEALTYFGAVRGIPLGWRLASEAEAKSGS